MKTKIYASPEMETIEIKLEQGIAQSGDGYGGGGNAGGGVGDGGETDEWE